MASVQQVIEAFLGLGIRPSALPCKTRGGSLEAKNGSTGMVELWMKRPNVGGFVYQPKLLAVRFGRMVNLNNSQRHLQITNGLIRVMNDAGIRHADYWADLSPDDSPSRFLKWGGWVEPDPTTDEAIDFSQAQAAAINTVLGLAS